jgi:L-lactate dehydrogenase complex protein LldE
MGVIGDSKSLLKQLINVNLTEIEREYECCGFGGTFSVKQPEMSAAMVQDKIDDIRQTGAKKVISGDCGCLANIGGALKHQNIDIKDQHIADFIWERING